MIKYAVQKDDTFETIAKKLLANEKKASRIAELNNIPPGTKLKEGTNLNVPASYYKTQKSDTLESIAQTQLGSSNRKNEIISINDLDSWPSIVLFCPAAASLNQLHSKILAPSPISSTFDNQCSVHPLTEMQLQVPDFSVERLHEPNYPYTKMAERPNELKAGTVLLLPIADLPTVVGDCYIEVYEAKSWDTLDSIAKGTGDHPNPARKEEIKTLNGIDYCAVVKEKKLFKVPMDPTRKEVKEIIKKNFTSPPSETGAEGATKIYVNMLMSVSWIEGCYSYMYRDPIGRVTVGAGHLVDNINLALPLLFYACDHARNTLGNCLETDHTIKATHQQITSAHAYVGEQPIKLSKKFYVNAEKNNLIIEKDDIVDMVKTFLKANATNIKADVSADPLTAIVAIFDITYNTGGGGWPNLKKAAASSDWVKASLDGRRAEPQTMRGVVKRNILAYELFIKAAHDTGNIK
jgi:LysM repeat protein